MILQKCQSGMRRHNQNVILGEKLVPSTANLFPRDVEVEVELEALYTHIICRVCHTSILALGGTGAN
jgi:hypothetical protein